MPIIIEAQYQKRLGLPGYSSHSFGVTVRIEVPDLTHFERESSQLYSLLQSSVDREIQQEGYVPELLSTGDTNSSNGTNHARNGSHQNGHNNGPSNGYRSTNRSNGNNRSYWKCSDKQKELILKIIEDNQLDEQEVEDLSQEMFSATPKALNKMEASGLIEELLGKYGKSKANGNGSETKTRIEVLTEEVSPSRLKRWSTCRLQFYFHYVAQIKKEPTPALIVGKVVHALFQEWNKCRWRGDFSFRDSLTKIFDAKWTEEQMGQKVNWKEQEEAEKQKTRALVEFYLDHTPVQSQDKPLAVEVHLEANLERHGLPNLIGILDLVQKGNVIVDYAKNVDRDE